MNHFSVGDDTKKIATYSEDMLHMSVDFFLSLFLDEIELGEVDYVEEMRKYYRFPKKIFRYHYIKRIQPIVDEIKKNGIRTILDAGCGIGMEALLFALLGCEVVGIDLAPRNINVANKRKKYYQELLGRDLHLEFQCQNIFDAQDLGKFDAIWLKEAIHHIEPPDLFIQFAYEHLKKNGRLFISDTNGSNPFIQIWFLKKRGFKFTGEYLDTKTGKSIKYGNEHIYIPTKLARKIKDAQMKCTHIQFQGFLPASFTPERWMKKLLRIERMLNKTSLAKYLALSYTITAEK